jgi:hypothetical protein
MTLVWDEAVSGLVNQERTATLTFKDNDVRAVYIDWDDGASNKKDEANYQWVEFSEPKSSTTVTHTYTASGTFFPIVQTVNSNGFVSRYYSANASEANVTPFTNDSGIGSCRVNDTNPTAIMRVENTTVKTGIDNSILSGLGSREIFFGIAPTITKAELNTIGKIIVEVEMIVDVDTFDQTNTADNDVNQQETRFSSLTTPVTQTITVDCSNSGVQAGNFNILNTTQSGVTLSSAIYGTVKKILKITYKTPWSVGTSQANAGRTYTTNDPFNRLKIFLYTKYGYSTYQYSPITYVTAGQPIKSVDESDRYIYIDMSQSRTAASNTNITNYRYDIGKIWFNPVDSWDLSTNTLATGTQQSGSIKQVHYSYPQRRYGLNNNTQCRMFYGGSSPETWYISGTTSGNTREDLFAIDDYGRFYDQYHMVRTSVLQNENAAGLTSNITTNQPEVLYVKPAVQWTSPGSITQVNPTSFTDAMKNNSNTSTSSGDTNIMMLSGTNDTVAKDINGMVIDNANKGDYILLLFDEPTNKVFFNCTNYANYLISNLSSWDPSVNGLHIASVEYLVVENPSTRTQNAYWKPLKYHDTMRISREQKNNTDDIYNYYHTTFAKSGYISYDLPQDWAAISLKNLCGGVYNTTGTPATDTPVGGAGFDDIKLVLSRVSASNPSRSGLTTKYNIDAASETLMDTLGVSEDVGAYKYLFIVTDSTTNNCSGAAYWLASGNDNGWDGSNVVHLQIGATGGTSTTNYVEPLGNLSGSLRRVNVYDVINGASKVFSDDGEVTYSSAQLVPVGGDTYQASTNYWDNLYQCEHAAFTGSTWSGTAKYALKLTLSGATGAGATSTPCPEVWNIFDGNQGHGAIVREIDDSAYSLNSLAITNDMTISQAGNYFKAITRKGKTFVVKTGVAMSTLTFSSVALGDINSATAFEDYGAPATLYGHLHKIRNLQTDNVPVYWDEPQKDGTFVRLWGNITDIQEVLGVDGPRSVTNFTFNMTITQVALLTNKGKLMTDIFPLGGMKYERDYS